MCSGAPALTAIVATVRDSARVVKGTRPWRQVLLLCQKYFSVRMFCLAFYPVGNRFYFTPVAFSFSYGDGQPETKRYALLTGFVFNCQCFPSSTKNDKAVLSDIKSTTRRLRGVH